ncbi:MAG: hypothetical protein RR333_06395 [Bacteroidales bacterium]
MKKKVSIAFLFLANLFLLVHLFLPHHHHQVELTSFTNCAKSTVVEMDFSKNFSVVLDFFKNSCSEHHGNSPKNTSDPCSVSDVFINQHSGKSCCSLDGVASIHGANVLLLWCLLPDIFSFDFFEIQGFPILWRFGLFPIYSGFALWSFGLRAPPIIG